VLLADRVDERLVLYCRPSAATFRLHFSDHFRGGPSGEHFGSNRKETQSPNNHGNEVSEDGSFIKDFATSVDPRKPKSNIYLSDSNFETIIMAEAHIEVDLEETSDEDYLSGGPTDTTSLSSTILEYQYENGRRYHAYKSGAYALPNDETEQERCVWPPVLLRLSLQLTRVDWTLRITSTTCSLGESFMSRHWMKPRHSGFST
jgi:hypothetical protein